MIFVLFRAIEIDSSNQVFYCNRAAAHSKMNNHYAAVEDCKRVRAACFVYIFKEVCLRFFFVFRRLTWIPTTERPMDEWDSLIPVLTSTER